MVAVEIFKRIYGTGDFVFAHELDKNNQGLMHEVDTEKVEYEHLLEKDGTAEEIQLREYLKKIIN